MLSRRLPATAIHGHQTPTWGWVQRIIPTFYVMKKQNLTVNVFLVFQARPSPIGAQTTPNSDNDEFDVISNRTKSSTGQIISSNNNNCMSLPDFFAWMLLLIEFDFQLCSIIARRDGPAQFLFAKATNKNTTIVFGRKFRISELRSIDQCSNCCTASASLQSIRRCGTTAKNQSVPTTSSTGTYHITLLFHFTNIQMHRLQTDTNSIWNHLGSVHQSIETTTIPSHLEPGSMDALQHE